MRFQASVAITAVLLTGAIATEDTSDKEQLRRLSRSLSQAEVSCRLIEGAPLYTDPEAELLANEENSHEWRCFFEDEAGPGAVKSLAKVPEGFFQDHQDEIKSGETILTITSDDRRLSTELDEQDVYEIPSDASLTLSGGMKAQNKNGKVPETVGERTVLVVRVIDGNGRAPKASAKELSDDIFGTTSDKVNLRSQYSACSGGKLDFVPGEGKNVKNGVVEVEIPEVVQGKSFFLIEQWVLPALFKVVEQPPEAWDLVMLVHPGYIAQTYIGYAYYNWVISHFRDTHVSELLVQMHEIGHNLNQYHSGEVSGGTISMYGDGTCMMGSHVYNDDAPLMCFNGAKSWYFGWYSDRHVKVDPSSGEWRGQLVGVDDYVNNRITDPDQGVIARIKKASDPTPAALYLLYNRKKGINSQVTEKADSVTVVYQESVYAESRLLGGVTEYSEPFRQTKWGGGKQDLVIQVCRFQYGNPDFAEVLVYLDDGGDYSCEMPTPQPTPLPTPSPTSTPTFSPTSPPTRLPTSPPTFAPTSPPTPTQAPSLSATPLPTLSMKAPPKLTPAPTVSVPGKVKAPPKVVKEFASFAVSRSEDDYKQLPSGEISSSSATHGLFTESDMMQAFRFTPTGENKIPRGAHIESAIMYVMPSSYNREIRDRMIGYAVGHDTGNAVGEFEISAAPKTTANVMIDPDLPVWERRKYQPLVDVSPIVQEITDRDDYVEGSTIELFLVGEGTGTSRKIKTWDGGDGAMLDVSYSYQDSSDPAESGDQNRGEIPDTPQPETVTLEVSHFKDDAKEKLAGKIFRGKSKHKLWDVKDDMQGYRFRLMPIPRQAKIQEARLEMMPVGGFTLAANITGNIQAEAVGNSPVIPYQRKYLRELTRTKAKVEVTNLPKWKRNQYNLVADVTPVVQEIVNYGDYKPGNAMTLILSNNNSTAYRVVKTFESGAPARLIVVYGKHQSTPTSLR